MLLEDDKGHEIVVASLNPGDFFGEIGLFNEDAGRTALVSARAECEIAHISYRKLRGLTVLYPDLIIAMTSQIARRRRNTNRKLGDLSFMDVYGRVARTFLDLCEEPDEMTHPDGMQVRVTPRVGAASWILPRNGWKSDERHGRTKAHRGEW